jgi:penicillin G amidase
VESASGLTGPVTISRGRYGVPHIIAGSREDALFGLGYVMAADRLWQMDLLRRKATGRLSEVAGADELQADRTMRLFGLEAAAARSVVSCSGDSCVALEAVSAGINHYMRNHAVPKGFTLARYRPEPWTPADSVAVQLMMGWALGGASYRTDLFAERSRQVIGDEWTDAMFAGRSAEAPPSVRKPTGAIGHELDAQVRAKVFPEDGFSNSWAVSGERSWTGYPLLAFDPHLEYTNPSIWYEAILEAPGFHVAGMTLPGLPGIGAGRSLGLAWGETASMISQSFLYREELSDDGNAVRDGDGWADLRVEEQKILVRDREPETLRLRYSPRGPLISDVFPELSDGPVSLHWTGMEDSAETDLLCVLNTARSVEEAIANRGAGSVPCYNASIADSEGNIAQMVIGRIPVREPRAGLLDPAEFPPAYIPVDEMPVEVNPARGWVAGANTRLVDDDYPYPMYGVWEPPYRMRRIADVSESRAKHSIADMRALQVDQYSLHAAELTPVVLDVLAGQVPDWVADDLQAWNFTTGPDSRQTAIFQAFYSHWMQVALRHRFPAEYVDTGLLATGAASVPRDFCDRLLLGDYPAWFDHNDDIRRALVRVAMDDGLEWLRDRLGDDHSRWAWGRINQMTFVHPLGMVSGPQSRWINPGPFPVGGDRTTVWPTAWRSRNDFMIRGGPSMRLVVDLRRPDLIWGTNTLGQNGSPWARHYRDQIDEFLTGRMHQIKPPNGRRRTRVVLRPDGS